jgi:hypothetical protein
MANNEIPRWAQAALERNERIQSKARSAVALMKLLEEQDRLSRLAPDTLGTVDPNYSEEIRYEAPGAIRDPESWLNRGLETLAGNAADVILGRPSENPVVDYGVANIPGVGAAAILGAGGQPGLVDAAGLGGLLGILKGAAKPVAAVVAKKASDYSKDAVQIAHKINDLMSINPGQGRAVLKELEDSVEYGDDIFNHDFFANVASEARNLPKRAYNTADKEMLDMIERLGSREQFGYDMQKQVSELLKDRDMLRAAKELHQVGMPTPAPSPEPKAVVQTQLADMKNKNRIPKYTYEFVADYFGDEGLKNLDNALSKYPKADKPSVNDAVEILRGGYGGERVLPTKPYMSENPYASFAQIALNLVADNIDDSRALVIRDMRDRVKELKLDKLPDADARRKFGYEIVREIDKNLNEYELNAAFEGLSGINSLEHYPDEKLVDLKNRFYQNVKQARARKYTREESALTSMYNFAKQHYGNEHPLTLDVRRYRELSESPTQDWETIIHKQELKDARDAEKEAKKAAKKAQEELKKASAPVAPKVAPKVEPVAPKEEPVVIPEPVATPVEQVVEPVVVPEVPKGGPNRWEENGWSSKDVNPVLFEKYGKNLNEKSKRDAFVADSLAKHWVNRLTARPGFTSAEILDNLDRANARHTFTNYDDVSRGFSDDIVSNLNSGNMPGTAVQLLQRYKNNIRVPGKTVPTMVLGIEERPKIYTNPRIWPDEAEGVDLYELLFRPMIDRKLNEINPNYWTY